MPAHRSAPELAVHATAVAIDHRAALIFGLSGSGKSSLAAALMARKAGACLVGDDRVLLTERSGVVYVRPHPRIAGFLERRGLGMVAVSHLAEAPVAGTVELGAATTKPAMLQNLPALALVDVFTTQARESEVLAWWDRTLRDAKDTSGKKRCRARSPAGTITVW